MLRYMRYPSENLTLHCFHHFSISGWYLIRKQVFGIIPISFPKTGSFHDLVETYSQQTFVIFIQRRANNIPNPAAPLGSRGETWRPSQRLLLLLSAFETNYQYLNKFPRYPLESRALYVFFWGEKTKSLRITTILGGKISLQPGSERSPWTYLETASVPRNALEPLALGCSLATSTSLQPCKNKEIYRGSSNEVTRNYVVFHNKH